MMLNSKAKQQSVDDALRRIGKLSGYELRPIIASSQEYHYRRRIRLQCDERKQPGLLSIVIAPLMQIERCLIADDRLNGVIDSLRGMIPNLATVVDFVEIVAGDEPNQLVVVSMLPRANFRFAMKPIANNSLLKTAPSAG